MGIISKLKGALRRMSELTGASKEFKDIFELGGVPAFNQFYYYGIFPWHYLYKGFYNAWHLIPAPTIHDPKANRELYRLNLPKAACAELAGLLWAEKCKVNVNLPGFEPTDEEPDDKAQRFIDSVLRQNNFGQKMQEAIEQMLALGGEALKVWCEEAHDENGNTIPGTGKIRIGYCMADQFVPTSWDNAKVSEGVFISRRALDGYYYTRLEWHKWDGETYVVSNELYRAEMRKGAGAEPQDILGIRYPLSAIYPYLAEETPITGLEQSLFSYMRTPIANNLDDNSPLGVSIYGNAMETLHALDIAFDSFVREFRLGKKRIIVPARAIRAVPDPDTGIMRRYFDANDEVYEALATDEEGANKITDNSVELRVEEHVEAINTLLQVLCLQLGFSANTFSFDTKGGLKTATEVVSENSKTFKTVKSVQSMLTPAIEDLVHNIFALAQLYDLEFEGEHVRSWFSETAPLSTQYECSLAWDDSIIEDKAAEQTQALQEVDRGLLSKKTYLMTMRGMTEEQADAELARIADESSIGGTAVDVLFGGAEE